MVGSVQVLVPTLVVTPDSGLRNGSVVAVTGSGFSPNSQGSLAECNDTAGAPTINVFDINNFGNPLSISCTPPMQTHTTTDGTGRFASTFTIRTGTLGPPVQGLDSSGHDSASRAADFPCPPTPEQIAVGNGCELVYIDAAGEKAVARISFASQAISPATSPQGGLGPLALPFSGFGIGLWRLDELGSLLSCLGGALLVYRQRKGRSRASPRTNQA
jgi:hypothetical protein